MKSKYLAGIDIGTTGAKAALFDLEGNCLASAYREYPCSYPRPNWIEQDPESLVAYAMEASKEAIYKSGVKNTDIAALAISSQRSCTIFIDKNGKPLRPMISWQDSRCYAELEEIRSKISDMDYYKITGFPNNTAWLLPKILWIRKNEPGIWEKTYKLVQLHDFTVNAFGADGYFNDISDAGFSGLWDTNELKWSPELMNIFDVDEKILPIPTPSAKLIGSISKEAAKKSGFLEGMPIVTGAGDQNSAAVGAGLVENGCISISMGTAGNANAYTDMPFRDAAGKIMVVNHAIYGKWQLEGHQAGAAGVYRWFRDEIGLHEKYIAEQNNSDAYKLLDELVIKTPAGSRGLVFMPFLASAAAPRWNPDAKGVLSGLTFAHDRGCLARAFLEGITLEMKDILKSLLASGIKPEKVILQGGSSKSGIWNQIQSDMYNLPVRTLRYTDAAVMGAAIMSGVGSGIFTDIKEAAKIMVKADQEYAPVQENVKIYDDLYDIYCRIYSSFEDNKIFEAISKFQVKLGL
ncbi:MAG: xylulose kinase [Actinobacteria bacterium]|nr:xylulose kinase [Actinomycetota bacterium]